MLLRIGLAVVFLYAAIAAMLDPNSWIGYFPGFLQNLIPAAILLPIFSFYEVLLALWLLSGRKLFYASMFAALTLVGIIGANTSLMDILFRDVAIFFAALALAALSRSRTRPM